MDAQKFTDLVRELTGLDSETEWVEFKHNNEHPEMIGQYLSALSNSAALLGKPKAYIVWGIDGESHAIVGTSFKPRQTKVGNEELENWLTRLLEPRIEVTIQESQIGGKNIVLFEIQPAFSQPVAFKTTRYIRVGSYTKKLRSYPEKERKLWSLLSRFDDWSAQICETANVDDLDPKAISKARRKYKEKLPLKANDVDSWDDITFLNKAKITIQSRITNTAILLLGREESASLISPAVAKISWILKDAQNRNLDYEHFGPPFFLSVERLFTHVRNLTIRHLPSGTLFPMEISSYDSWVIREALHNCIAHQDYSLSGRIDVIEFPSQLLFTNLGRFLPGSVDAVIRTDAPPEFYRNQFLADAMVNLSMIDTQGGGIKTMFEKQMTRFFPMPSYDISRPDRVEVRIHGEILDERYTKMLMENTELDLWTAILLDKVQKGVRIDKEAAKILRSRNLIEGRYPNLFISEKIASAVGQEAKHIRNRGFDKKYYQDMVIKFLKTYSHATRKNLNDLLWNKLPEIMSEEQKSNKIHNIISEMARNKIIQNKGSRLKSKWILNKNRNSE